MSRALELNEVTVTYGGRRGKGSVIALSKASIKVNRGERVAVVGRSGAGKSTIARLACGLAKPSSGVVSSLGINVNSASRSELRALRQRMHMVFQDPYSSLHPGMSVGQIVSEPLNISRSNNVEAEVEVALDQVGLRPAARFLERRPSSLSGGQRQRVAIARALVARPELILADEPTSMLDASLRASIANLLLELQESQHAALVFITHDLTLARQVAERILVVADGRIVEDAPTEQLLSDPQHHESKLLLDAVRA